ncbi:Spermine oxidase [Triplophysa tibetana]|uniref:Spermine oxidase n=1 Tax=Triplophysa tibetana TaxID=1572043 RepID=A0A5A9P0J3_9TELE|nr:Spermine oxidase [Triplophysa tibetana]
MFSLLKKLNKSAGMSNSKGPEEVKVVVVGSGFAGVAAAATLVKAGFQNVLVLEAKDRVGGRVHTTKPFTDKVLEVGANWIHGQKGNPLFQLAKEHNLLSEESSTSTNMCSQHSVTSKNYFFREDGMQVPKKVVDQVRSRFTKLTDKAFDDELDCRHRKMTLGGYLDDAYDEFPIASTVNGQMVFEWCKRLECTDEACSSLYEVSAAQISNYTDLEGGFFNTLGLGGYRALLDVLLKDLPPGSVQCNAEVKTIQWDLIKKGDREEPKLPVRITCENGQSYDADHVIFTASLGVLKDKAATMFEPPLPQPKLNAIKNLGFGIVDKIFLYFEEKFWPDDCAGVQMVWEEGPEDEDVYNASSEGDDWKETWYKKITGFDTVARHPTALLGWITGREALHMETLEDSEIRETCVRLLRTFTGWTVPEASKTLISRWGHDSHVRGSYTFVPHRVDGVEEHKALAAPLPPKVKTKGSKPLQVLFAGEATHVNFYTTTHGAYMTGVREAQRLISYHSD